MKMKKMKLVMAEGLNRAGCSATQPALLAEDAS